MHYDIDHTGERVVARGVALPDALWDRLRQEAGRRGLSRSALIRLLIAKHLEDGSDAPLFMAPTEAASRLTPKQ